MNQIKLVPTGSYKTGLNEIQGLKQAMLTLIKPVQESIKDRVYWNDCAIEESEYLGRDGFIPHSHNCGGLEIFVVIPKCESYEFGFLEFGECDECHKPEYTEGDGMCGYNGVECAADSDGHLDAKLRIWFKFEGYDAKTGELNFWLYAGGGNGDAPYFRTKYETAIFEATFSCKSVAGLKRAATKHINALLKKLEA